jgi:hypothetical protein
MGWMEEGKGEKGKSGGREREKEGPIACHKKILSKTLHHC